MGVCPAPAPAPPSTLRRKGWSTIEDIMFLVFAVVGEFIFYIFLVSVWLQMVWQHSWQMLFSYEKFFAVRWTPRPTPHDWLNLILGKHYFRYIHSCDFTNYFFSISQKFRRGRGEPWYRSGAERSEHHGHRPPCTEVSVSGDYDLASGQVRRTSFAARWTLVRCATLASVLFCRFQPTHHST